MVRETAIQDMVKDYTSGGNNLIIAYEGDRQKALDSSNINLDDARRQLSVALEEIQAGVAKTSKRMEETRLIDFERQWNVERQRLMDATQSALGHCAQ